MSTNSSAICGRKTSTPPTPPSRASERKLASQRTWTWASTCRPSQAKNPSISPCIGAATVKITWKKANIVTKKTSVPQTGCSSTASTRRVRASTSGTR